MFRDLADFGMGMNVPPPVMSSWGGNGKMRDGVKGTDNYSCSDIYC